MLALLTGCFGLQANYIARQMVRRDWAIFSRAGLCARNLQVPSGMIECTSPVWWRLRRNHKAIYVSVTTVPQLGVAITGKPCAMASSCCEQSVRQRRQDKGVASVYQRLTLVAIHAPVKS
jgi:hypothetical protein